jgi:putative nucleotidyltransferase with HDIG domain
MVDSRSYFTNKHSKRVTDYAMALAKALHLDKETTQQVENSALLHDIGKLAIDGGILNKAGELTEQEWKVFKTHAQLGADVLKQIPQLAKCAEPVLHHHERYDGTGYPEGQRGESIPLVSRIIAIANEFTYLTSERMYSESKTHEKALEEVRKQSGSYFDPYLVEQFVSIFQTEENVNKKKARR